MEQPLRRRSRLRRGGPRTPIPLLPVIAVAAGVGLAYVNQTAHATTAGYHAAQLTAQQAELKTRQEQLHDELARLQSSERIVAAAERFGMRPASRWAYVASQPVVVVPSVEQAREASASRETVVQRFLAALLGDFGPPGAP
jgi:hypothetical protein